jgi:hypothetical protein
LDKKEREREKNIFFFYEKIKIKKDVNFCLFSFCSGSVALAFFIEFLRIYANFLFAQLGK